MKILVLSHISELLGGAERSMLDVLDRWADEYGVEPQVVMRKPVKSLGAALDARGWKYWDIDYGFWSDGSPPVNPEDIFRNAERNSRAIQEIERLIEQEKPDLVLTNSLVCPWAALAAYFQNVPHVWFVREYGDLDHGRAFEIGREKTLADVGTLSDLVVANSKTLETHLAQYMDSDKLTTLYTPFDLDGLTKRSQKKASSPYKHEDSLKLITTNNIAPTKGQHEAIAAVAKLVKDSRNVELCIMGSGSKQYTKELEEMVAKHDVEDRVHFAGSQPDTMPYIALSDIGIMASRKEAFGRATFECLATGRPVVGADTGATPEMIESGVNGYLYTQGDSDSLAEKIKNYIDNNELLTKHGSTAHKTAVDMMAGDNNVNAAYEDIVKTLESRPEKRDYLPVNYLHRWVEYTKTAQQTMDKAHTFSFRRILVFRLKRRLRPVYLWLQGVKSRMKG